MAVLDTVDQRITVVGKQVLLDGKHLADARDDKAALVIGFALASIGAPATALPVTEFITLTEFFA